MLFVWRFEMTKIERFFIVIVLFCASSILANAQIPKFSYLYLETLDSNQKPVSEAKVTITYRDQQEFKYTDAWGECKFWFPKEYVPRFTIIKPDYYPFYDFGVLRYGGGGNIKVELLKIPALKSERKALDDEQSKREFFWAIQSGDVQSVRKFIKSGISPNLTIGNLRGVSGYENIPAVMYPAEAGDGAMLKLLLENGADVRRKDEYLSNIFFYYFQANPLANKNPKTEAEKTKTLREYDEGLKALIKARASLNANIYGRTPLVLAVETGLVNAVKILIAGGANVNAKDYLGRTPLAIAQERYYKDWTEYQKIIKLLEAAGAK